MTGKKKRLGRGLDALLSKPAARPGAATEPAGGQDVLKQLPLELLQRGQYQPRVDMRQDSLEELANSIRVQGVVQPIVARPLARTDDTQRYEIIAGERRWRAAQLAGLHEIPVVIRDVPDEAAIAMALIENIQREDLNPLEEARALDRLIREFDLTHAEAATAIGRSRASVSNLLRLQDLADKVKPLLESRQIEMGHARALLAIDGRQSAVRRRAPGCEEGPVGSRDRATGQAHAGRLGSQAGEQGGPGRRGYPASRDRGVGKARRESPHRSREKGHGQAGDQLQQPRRAGRHSEAHPLKAGDILLYWLVRH